MADASIVMASLAMQGAGLLDPVRFRYIEAMVQRTQLTHGATKRVLEHTLAQALADYRDRFESARQDAVAAVEQATVDYPNSLNDVQRLFEKGDFKGVKQHIDRLTTGERREPLAELTRYLLCSKRKRDSSQVDEVSGTRTFEAMLREQETAALQTGAEAVPPSAPASPRSSNELQSMQFFRDTWAKLSADKRVAQAIEKPSENAGPLNSHRLVIRSLGTMRDISPDYLNRFVAYVDTLLWLEQAGTKNDSVVAKAQPGKGKTKPRRRPAA